MTCHLHKARFKVVIKGTLLFTHRPEVLIYAKFVQKKDLRSEKPTSMQLSSYMDGLSDFRPEEIICAENLLKT